MGETSQYVAAWKTQFTYSAHYELARVAGDSLRQPPNLMLLGLKAGMTPFLTLFHCALAVSADSRL